MKKLMTMLSAAALAFGLRAADTGTSFEGMAPGPLDTASSTGELTAPGEGQSYWSATNENCAATVVDGQSIARSLEGKYPSQYIEASQKKYLEVKTTFGNPLERKAKADGTGVALAGNSFYIDTLVKFTIFDSEPEFSKYEGAKLMAWLQEEVDANDEPTGVTNFCIRAGYAKKQTRTYVMDTIFEPTAWHRLTVKAIPTIYKDADVPGFVVFVDGEAMGAVSEGNQDHGIDNSKVDARYLDFLDQGRLFLSMDQGSSGQAISAVAFDGQGCVDDLVFTETQPFAAAADSKEEYVTLTWDAGVSGLSYTIAGDEKVTPEIGKGLALIRYKAGMTITISDVMYAEGYMADAFEATWMPTAANESKVISSLKAAAKFGDTSYATVAEAFAAAQNAKTAGTIKLFEDYEVNIGGDSALPFYNEAEVIFDLAGKKITGSIASCKGKLVICDSAGTGTVDGWVGAVKSAEEGGAETAELEIQGGKYQAADADGEPINTLDEITAYATPGKIFELVDNYYVLTTPKVAKIGSTKYETLAGAFAAASYGDTVEMIDNVEFNEPLVVSAYSCTLDLATFNLTWTGAGTTDPIVISNGTLTIQATVTEGETAGSIVKTAGNATLIRVGLPANGADPDAEGYVPAAEGSLTIEGGTFKNYGSNVIKVEKGSLTMNGGTVENTKDGERGLRAAKATGVTETGHVSITVNGGTIIATTPLDIEPDGYGTITVPGTSTAKFSADVSAFCAEGYETVQEGEFYVVQKKGSEPGIKPVNPGDTKYESEDAAAAAAAAINADKEQYINLPTGAESIDKAAYTSMFTATASGVTVTVALTADATTAIQAQVDGEVKKVDVKAVAAAAGESLTQAIKTTPGLFYSVIAGDTLTGMTVKSCTLATRSETTVTLPKFAGKGFYRIQATVAPVTPVGQ